MTLRPGISWLAAILIKLPFSEKVISPWVILKSLKPKRATPRVLNLKAGDWVEIRSCDEILATLDQNGRLDNLPFITV